MCQCCPGTCERCLVGCRIDLIELLTGADQIAFLEQPLEHNAVHLRTNLRNPEGRYAPRKLRGE